MQEGGTQRLGCSTRPGSTLACAGCPVAAHTECRCSGPGVLGPSSQVALQGRNTSQEKPNLQEGEQGAQGQDSPLEAPREPDQDIQQASEHSSHTGAHGLWSPCTSREPPTESYTEETTHH